MNAKQKILLLTYAKFAYMQNLRICKSLPCVHGFSLTAKEQILNRPEYIYNDNVTDVMGAIFNVH